MDQSEAEERLNDDIFRDIWSPVGHVRPTIFRFIAYASNLHAATSAPHQTSPTIKTRRRSTWIPFPTNLSSLGNGARSERTCKKEKEREKNKRLSYQRGTLATRTSASVYNRERLNKTILKQESKNHPCNITLSLWKRKTRRRTRRKAYDKATAKLNRIVRLMERPCFSLYLTSRNFVNLTNSPKLRDYPTENWNIVMREIRQAPIGRKILDESWEKVAQVAKTREGTISTFGSRSPFFFRLRRDLRPSFIREINAIHCLTPSFDLDIGIWRESWVSVDETRAEAMTREILFHGSQSSLSRLDWKVTRIEGSWSWECDVGSKFW